MQSLLNPECSFSSIYPIHGTKSRNGTHGQFKTSLQFSLGDRGRWIGRNSCFTVKAGLDSATIDQLGLKESDIINPAISSSYRSSKLPKPNQTVLDAQARVCTGPTQTRPLDEDQAFKVLDTILRSARGELKDEEEVSRAQLGAFFAAMTIRANVFPEATQWSEGERRAMNTFWPLLVRALPPDVIFIADPEGSIMGLGGSIGPHYAGNDTSEMRLVGALREVLAGGHLGFEEVQGVLRDVLPLKEDKKAAVVKESLLSAFLIGQRMNRETDRELKAFCLAFDDELGSWPVADVKSLTHYGEPYDGNTRFFRSTLFVAAVRSCYGESCLLHGVEWMPPKGGVTEEQMLKFMGSNTKLSLLQAKELLEDEEVGFAYISQREARPSLYSLTGLREHIKKRPPLATTEKVQRFVRAKGREAIVAGFYHEGFEEPLLMLMKRRGVHSGLVVKGEEGALSMTTRLRSGNVSKGLPVNYCSGFRSLSLESACEVDGVSRQSFNLEVKASDYGFEPTDTPRTDRSIQHPRIHLNRFDLVITPRHDYYPLTPEAQKKVPQFFRRWITPREPPEKHVVLTTGALHNIDFAALRNAASAWHDEFAPLPKPIVVVNIGGPAGCCRYGSDLAKQLTACLLNVLVSCGSVRISFSNRTPEKVSNVIIKELGNNPKVYIWDGQEPNPHMGHLAWGDAFVVTADSISMISEACSTGKPVYVVGADRCTWKFADFHKSLRERGVVRPFTGSEDMSESWSYPPLNDTAEAASRVHEALADRGWRVRA